MHTEFSAKVIGDDYGDTFLVHTAIEAATRYAENIVADGYRLETEGDAATIEVRARKDRICFKPPCWRMQKSELARC